MKIAVVGASGNAGSRITNELAGRGHASPPSPATPRRSPLCPTSRPRQGDVHGPGRAGALFAGHDVAISSVHFLDSDPVKLIGAARIRRSAAISWSAAPAASKSRPASGW